MANNSNSSNFSSQISSILTSADNITGSTSPSSIETGINFFHELEQDLKREWRGDSPNINFFLLIASLLAFIAWVLFISFFFSRAVGCLVSLLLRRFLIWLSLPAIRHASVGSFSVSVISGKIMFKDLRIVTDDISLIINEGFLIFSYWVFVPQHSQLTECMKVSRLYLYLNGLQLGLFNRLSVYQNLAKMAFPSNAKELLREIQLEPAGQHHQDASASSRNLEMLEMQLNVWWDKLWRLFGAIRVDIGSARVLAGNKLLPTTFCVTFDDLTSKFMLTEASNVADRFMLRVKGSVEHFRTSLVKTANYVGTFEEPPRTMGGDFVLLQTAVMQFFYHQDLLGVVRDDSKQRLDECVPVWESIWRLDKNTVINYSPWTDKQRSLLYNFFFPSEFGVSPVTKMPGKNQRRVLISHEMRVVLLRDASFDIWFMRAGQLESMSSTLKQGSTLEFLFPWTTAESGSIVSVTGSFLRVETITSLPYRKFFACETFLFAFNANFPRAFNHQQQWNFDLELHNVLLNFIWDHKRFVSELIDQWSSAAKPDLCNFSPFICSFKINVLEKFNVLLLLNDKNWVDVSSMAQNEQNLLGSVRGSRLYLCFDLDFTEFAPKTVPLNLKIKMEEKLSFSVRLPTNCALSVPFFELLKSAESLKWINSDKEWINMWTTDSISCNLEYEYHPKSYRNFCRSPIPSKYLDMLIPPPPKHPNELSPDNIFVEILIAESNIQLTGMFVRLLFAVKDNYFGLYDSISDPSKRDSQCLHHFTCCEKNSIPEDSRPLNVSLTVQIDTVIAKCPIHRQSLGGESEFESIFNPLVTISKIIVELKKTHAEAQIQAVTSPIRIQFDEAADRWASISAIRFRGQSLFSDSDVPWRIEYEEYAWLTEFLMGECLAQINVTDLIVALHFLDLALFFVSCLDEEMTVPKRFQICQHFQLAQNCAANANKSGKNAHDSSLCPSAEHLKYRHIRLSIDNVNLSLFADDQQTMLKIQLENGLRISHCNLHFDMREKFSNLVIICPLFNANVLLALNQSQNGNQRQWVDVGSLSIKQICLDFGLPSTFDALSECTSNGQIAFLQRHDKASRRLPFVWSTTEQFGTNLCACFAPFRFFEGEPTLELLPNSFSDFTPFVTFDEKGVPLQMFARSLLFPHCLCVLSSDTDIDSPMAAVSEVPQAKDELGRKQSSSHSFHSTSSQQQNQKHPPAFDSLLNNKYIAELQRYNKFLDIYSMSRERHGFFDLWLYKMDIDTLRGLKKLRIVSERRHSAVSPVTSQKEFIPTNFVGDYDDEQVVLRQLRQRHCNVNENRTKFAGKLAHNIEFFATPILLKALENIATEIYAFETRSHPAFILQRIYNKCNSTRHQQPIIPRERTPKLQIPSDILGDVALPIVDICLFQVAHLTNLPSLVLCKSPRFSLDTNSKKADQNGIFSIASIIPQLQLKILKINEWSDRKQQQKNIGMDAKICGGDKREFAVDDHNTFSDTNCSEIPSLLNFCPYGPQYLLDVELSKVHFELSIVQHNTTASTYSELNMKIGALNVSPFNERPGGIPNHSFDHLVASIYAEWIREISNTRTRLLQQSMAFEEARDLTLIKMLAFGLDPPAELMDGFVCSMGGQELGCVKPSNRFLNSCPSCKLIHCLLTLHNKQQNADEWWNLRELIKMQQIIGNQKRRVLALEALLRHWQPLICSQIQLIDQHSLAKYARTNAEGSGVVQQRGTISISNGVSVGAGTAQRQHLKMAHRRMASNTESAEATAHRAVESQSAEPLDLYHRILQAHKEYKEKRHRRHQMLTVKWKVGTMPQPNNFTPEELPFSLFFFPLFEELSLGRTLLDSLAKFIPFLEQLKISLKFRKIVVSVVERKSFGQQFPSFSVNPFLNVDELRWNSEMHSNLFMDVNRMRPLSAIFSVKCSADVQNVRFSVSMPSLYFIINLKQCLQRIVQTNFVAPKKDGTGDNVIALSEQNLIAVDEQWVDSLNIKMRDHKSDDNFNQSIQLTFDSDIACEMFSCEGLLTDLFFSLTSHCVQNATQFQKNVGIGTEESGNESLRMENRVQKTSLIIAENIRAESEQRPTSTASIKGTTGRAQQILNCTMRDLVATFEGVLGENIGQKRRQVSVKVDLIQGMLPMHAESIHEVISQCSQLIVLRHGTQLNQQFHLIVGPPHQNMADSQIIRERLQEHRQESSSGATTGFVPTSISNDQLSSSSLSNESLVQDQHQANQEILSGKNEPIRTVHQKDSFLGSLSPLDFSVEVVTFELSAQLFPSLKVQYKLDGALIKGKCESEEFDFENSIQSHQLHFVVTSNSIGGKSVQSNVADTFSLPLPLLNSSGIYRNGQRSSIEVSLTFGPIVHSFSTDLLNQVLLAQETLRNELLFLWKKLLDEKWGTTGKSIGHHKQQQNLPDNEQPTTNALLFNIDVRCKESELAHHWLQIAATTPTGIAAILILYETHFQIGNKWTCNESIMAQAYTKLSLKLCQIYKCTLYEEAKEEQREFATFITQISAKNEMPFNQSDTNCSLGRRHWLHNYSISLIRPFLMMRPKALDKAILFWLNYRNTYNCWREERNKLLQMSGRSEEKRRDNDDEVMWRKRDDYGGGEGESVATNDGTGTENDLEFQLSVSIRDGFHACMPLLGPLDDSSTVLAVSLHHTEVQVLVQHQINCEANFANFKISFLEGFEDAKDSMGEDPWARLDSLSSDDTSNFLFFPHGSYRLNTSAISAQKGINAKWLLSIVANMEGMILDLDNKIGKFVSSLVNTLSSITAFEEEDVEDIVADNEAAPFEDDFETSSLSSTEPNLLNPLGFLSVRHRFSAPPIAAEAEGDAHHFRHRVHSLEKKMHEQAMLVADLANCGGVSELTLETERRKLRQLEQLHLREFRQLMVTKLKGHVSTKKQHHQQQRNSANEQPQQQQQRAPPLSSRNLLTRPLECLLSASGSSGGGTPRERVNNRQGNAPSTEHVDMNIDVKVYIESGKCILRADPSKQQLPDKNSFLPGHRRQPSAGTTSMAIDSTTQLSLPSVDARFFYTSDDVRMPLPEQMEQNFEFARPYRSLNQKCFYTSLELASMPLTSLITPALIDFLDQTIEPFSNNILDTTSAQKAFSEISSDGKLLDPTTELIAIDRFGLSFDLIFHISVQASTIRFEGRQQKSSAADCLLTLPSLTLNGCTRKCCDGTDRPMMAIYGWLELNSFSLSIYSPHQQTSAHDALSLTLDRLRVNASRTRNFSDHSSSNDIRLVAKIEAGKVSIVHDMRRLDELISFPKAWYRKKLIRRLFLGQKSLKAPNNVAERKGSSMSTEQSVGCLKPNAKKADPSLFIGVGTDWKALVDLTFEWEEMNVNAQMSTTMGFTTWLTKGGSTELNVMFDSSRNREFGLRFSLGSSQIVADGGVISGEMQLNSLAFSIKYSKFVDKAPEHKVELQLELLQSKIEWMGRSIFIVRIIGPKVCASDKWHYKMCENSAKVKEAHCLLSVDSSWSDLDLIIARTTTADFIKIGQKLRVFFEDQLHNSRVIWEEQFGEIGFEDGSSSIAGGDGSNVSSTTADSDLFWHDILDALSEIQLHQKFLPLPDADDGITFVGGDLNIWARRISLACMDGETTNAAVWALFHMVEPGIGISSCANYEFVVPKDADALATKQIQIALLQKFNFRLGNLQQQSRVRHDQSQTEKCKAIICRVQYSRGSMLHHNSPIDHCISALIDDVLAQLRDVVGGKVPSSNASELNNTTASSTASVAVSPTKLSHNFLQLFQFSALDALLTNLQHQPIVDEGSSSESVDNVKATFGREDATQTVLSKFVCQFHDAVRIQTEFNAQLGFLPELLRSYLQTESLHKKQIQRQDTFSRFPSLALSSSSAALVKSPKDQNNGGLLAAERMESPENERDQRIYICEEWDVDPKIQFIDRFKWNPPVIDDILKRLQIFDHRRTIPKVMQRTVFDRWDQLLIGIFSQMLAQLRRDEKR